MRVGVVTPEYPPYTGGGIGTATVSFVNHMALAGHHLDVFTILPPEISGYDPSRDEEVERSPNIAAHYLSYHLNDSRSSESDRKVLAFLEKHDLSLAKSWIVSKKLARFLREQSLDVIFAAEYLGLPAYFLLEQKRKPLSDRIPVVVTIHTGLRELSYANYLTTKSVRAWERGAVNLERVTIEFSTVLHCPSVFLANFMQNTYGIDRPIGIIPYFPAFIERGTYPTKHKRSSSEKNVLYVGRIERRKGVKELVLAATKLLREDRSYRFVIAGGDWHDEITNKSFSEEVKRLVPEPLSDRVTFIGQVPHLDLPNLISTADVVIVPSLFENYPNTCMEPAQLGVPVIVSRSGGMTEIVGDDHQMSFDPISPSEIAERLRFFFGLPEAERCEKARKQREFFLNKHAPDTLVSAYEKLIDSARELHRVRQAPQARKPAIAVGIPVCNLGNYFDECIESVIAQSRPADRVVVIDDGSTDPLTIDKLSDWKERKPDLEIVRQDNVGLCATRNRLIDTFEHEDYFLMLDADDKLHRDYLLTTEQYMINNPSVSACATWVENFGEDTELWTKPPFSFPDALIQNMIISSVALIRRSALPREVRFNERLSPFTAEDWDFWINFHKRGNEIGVIPEPLFHYRVRRTSKWHSLNFRKYMVIMDHLIQNHREVYEQHMDHVLMQLLADRFIETNTEFSKFWASVANSLPQWLILLLRKNSFTKRMGDRLLTGK